MMSDVSDPGRPHLRGEDLPSILPGYGPTRPYADADRAPRVSASSRTAPRPDGDKRLATIAAALDACDARDGCVFSFHHHLRNGDAALNQVMAAAGARGLQDITVAASSLFPVHAPLAELMARGTVGGIRTDYMLGPAADAVAAGVLARPAILQTHGGRARAITSGELAIDIAFIAAPVADMNGNVSGAFGRAACGPLGYPMVDADHAARVVVLAEDVVDRLPGPAEIAAERVDHVVRVESIGDPGGIASGTTRPAIDPGSREIAALAARAIATSGVMTDGFSFQTGAGGISLAIADLIGADMQARGLRGGFLCGGITGAHVALAKAGLFTDVVNVQSFDLAAVASFRDDAWHRGISAAEYASPIHPDPATHRLSCVVLGAAEIDRDFNVNVTVGGDGRIMGGPGGHPDTAAGAALTVITTKLVGGGFPKVVEQVRCITTPGRDVDLLVTDAGLAVNPRRPELAHRLASAGLATLSMDRLIESATAQAGPAQRDEAQRAPAAYVEYRDGSIIDRVA